MPNKSIFLEKEVVARLLQLSEETRGLDLRQLLVKILTRPELTGNTRSVHFLRVYHMVDLLMPTTAEDVEYVLSAGPEFVASEKKEGMYFYQEVKAPAEVTAEEEIPAEASLLSSLAEQLTSGEAEAAEAKAEAAPAGMEAPEEVRPAGAEIPPAAPQPETQIRLEPLKKRRKKRKKNRYKKKKPKGEAKGPRPKKSERRVIEEKIIEEESEIEALEAIKAQEEELEEAAAGGKETIPVEIEVAKEEPKFGFFAEMLKSAWARSSRDRRARRKRKAN